MGRLRGDNDRDSTVWWHKQKKTPEIEARALAGFSPGMGRQEARGTSAKVNHGAHQTLAEEVLETLPWRRKDLYHRCSPRAGKEQMGTLNSKGGQGTTCFEH